MPILDIDFFLNEMRRLDVDHNETLTRILKDPALLRQYQEKYPEENTELWPYFLSVAENANLLTFVQHTPHFPQYHIDSFIIQDEEKRNYAKIRDVQTKKGIVHDLLFEPSHEFNILLIDALSMFDYFAERLVIVELLGYRGQIDDHLYIFSTLAKLHKKEKRSAKVIRRMEDAMVDIVRATRSLQIENPDMETVNEALNFKLLDYWLENSRMGRLTRLLLEHPYLTKLSEPILREVIDRTINIPKTSPLSQVAIETAMGILGCYLVRELSYTLLLEYLEVERSAQKRKVLLKLRLDINPHRPII